MKWTFLELPKFNKTNTEIKDGKDCWAAFLKNAVSNSNMSDEEESYLMPNDIMKLAYERIDQNYQNDKEARCYRGYEDGRRDKNSALIFSYEEGVQEGKEIARKKIKAEKEAEIDKIKEENKKIL